MGHKPCTQPKHLVDPMQRGGGRDKTMTFGSSICRRSRCLQMRPFSAGLSLSSRCSGNHTRISQRYKVSALKAHGKATPHPITSISHHSLTRFPSPSLCDGHHGATRAPRTWWRARMLLLTWTWRTTVPTVVFSKRLTLYRTLLKMGRLSFSLMRLIFTRAKPTWSGTLSFAKSWAEMGSKGEGWRHCLQNLGELHILL